jgi:MFS transporter, DHA2 family, multidrug resistance protein
MSYFGVNKPEPLEEWEEEEGRYISAAMANLSKRKRMILLMSVALVTAIEVSNRLSINVLLPDMQGNVAADADEISWVVILYNLGFLCSLALASWMTRVIGARRHLLFSIALYSVGAFGCFLSSHTLRLLLASRIIMGFGGGAFLVRAVILARLMFPGKAQIVAVTWLYSVLAFFEIVYPVAMGTISDQLHWNYAFLLDFPFLAIGVFLIAKIIPPGFLFQRKQTKVDVWGAALLIIALACYQTASSRGERDLWFETSWITVTLVVAVVCFVAFLWWESRPANEAPVFHLRTIFRHAALRSSVLIVLIVGGILGAGLFVLPQYLRYVQDYSAAQTGAFISMYTAGLGLGLVIGLNFVTPRLGGPRTLVLGLLLLIATCVLLVYVWTPTTPARVLAPAIFLQGFSLGFVLRGASTVSLANTPEVDVNDVSTAFFFLRQLGNTFGVTAATVMFDHRMTFHSSRILDLANRLDPILRSTLAQYANLIHRNGGSDSNPALGALQLFQADVIRQSRLLSYIDIYFGLAVLAGVALILLAIGRVKRKPGTTQFHAC